ncbi:unnamed protein product [Amoebophrya sp. A120]|nr:unnamed protein product [Amoebophrya sp. A120]|eukprot:GSA120T00009359001.1
MEQAVLQYELRGYEAYTRGGTDFETLKSRCRRLTDSFSLHRSKNLQSNFGDITRTPGIPRMQMTSRTRQDNKYASTSSTGPAAAPARPTSTSGLIVGTAGAASSKSVPAGSTSMSNQPRSYHSGPTFDELDEAAAEAEYERRRALVFHNHAGRGSTSHSRSAGLQTKRIPASSGGVHNKFAVPKPTEMRTITSRFRPPPRTSGNSGGVSQPYSSSNNAKVQQNMKKKSKDSGSASSQYYRQESQHERPHRTSSSRNLQQTQRGLPIPSPASSTGKMSSRSGVDVVSTRAPTKEEVLESSYESDIDDPNHIPHSVYDQHRARPTSSSSTYNNHAPMKIFQQRPPAHVERDFEGHYSYNHANTTGNNKSSSRTPVVRSSAKQPLLVGFSSAAQEIEIHQDQVPFHLAHNQKNDAKVAAQRPRTKDHVVEKQYYLDDNDRPMSRTMTPMRYRTAAPMYSTYSSTAKRYTSGPLSAPKTAAEVEDFDATASGKVKIVTASSSSSSYSSKRPPPGSVKTPSSSKRIPVTEVNLLQDEEQEYAGGRSKTTGDSFHPNSRTAAAGAPRSRGRYGDYNHEEHTATATASDPVLISTRKLHRKQASTPGQDVDFNQYETLDFEDDQEALHNYNLYAARKISKPHPISSLPSYSDACRAGCGLYERNTMWKKRIESRCYEKKEEQEREKLAECTFTPRLLNSATKTAKSPMFFAGQSSSAPRGAGGEENNSKPKRRRRPQSARAAMTSSSKANRFIRTTPLPHSARRTGDQEQYQQSNFFKRQELWQQFVEDKIEKKRRKSMRSMYEEQRKMESIRRANSAQATHPRELTLRMRQFYENNLEWARAREEKMEREQEACFMESTCSSSRTAATHYSTASAPATRFSRSAKNNFQSDLLRNLSDSTGGHGAAGAATSGDRSRIPKISEVDETDLPKEEELHEIMQHLSKLADAFKK